MSIEKQMMVGEVPVSPFSRLFSMPGFDCFNIVTIGFKNEASPSAFIEGLKNTLLNHPRFSCILVITPSATDRFIDLFLFHIYNTYVHMD